MKRKLITIKDYSKLKKAEILKDFNIHLIQYSNLRKLYSEKSIEVDYLNRRIDQLNLQVRMLTKKGKRTFRYIKKSIKKNEGI